MPIVDEFINIHISLEEEKFDLFYAYAQFLPFSGIEEDLDKLIITFPNKDWTNGTEQALVEILKKIDPNAHIFNKEKIADKNWNEEWEKNTKPVIVNSRIAITPEWRKQDIDTEIQIIINPKMSFGTGEHATTRLCCRLIEQSVSSESSWIDAGTGTGVLAILAIKLGAKSVFAFDNNEWSLENAKENILLNNCESQIELQALNIEEATLPDVDGIIANLFLNLLLPSFGLFYKALKKKKGDLICSGVLKYDRDLLVEAAIKAGFKIENELIEEEWIALHFKVI